MSKFYALKISAVHRLTPQAVALTFEVPQNLKATFAFKAGQYITLKHSHNSQELRRAYSIASAPSSGELTVGVKKVPNGSFSVYANETIQVGDILEVMPPEGRFVFENNITPQNIAAFAAGSGITPIISIAQTVLESHPKNTFVLVFGNQSPQEIMFLQQIQDLEQQYPDRFFVQYLYSRSREEDALFGRIESSIVHFILTNKFKDVAFNAFYLCGPGAMIDAVADTLKNNGVAEAAIFFERFTSSEAEAALPKNLEGKTQVEVTLDEETFSFLMDAKEVVLDAVLKRNINAPYSCQGGICSSCMARIKEGQAQMAKNQILTDEEVAEGLILTCQAHPTSPVLKVDYDDV